MSRRSHPSISKTIKRIFLQHCKSYPKHPLTKQLAKSVKRSIGEILGRSSVRGTSSSAICQCSRVALHVVGYYVEDFRRED
ncbi:hypothetical protein CEXT_11411 [Caerostris extrusa]|uniref:Uncharacterized protein n=1 Tax=Caerostris extrusa TaxID=172846 RepID=A0AAV4NIS7_CAEEX|nr:hypothetical protein CEXT_11411 [Caerostris extrusa]